MKIIAQIWLAGFLAAALAVGLLAAPQGNSDKNKKQQQTKADKEKSADQDKSKDKDKDQKTDDSGFGGTITAKGSKQTKDTATLGFKGVGPDGQVDTAKLKESPTGDDERIAQLMTGVKTNPEEAKAFIDNGKLKSR